MPQALYRFERLSVTTTRSSYPRRLKALVALRPS